MLCEIYTNYKIAMKHLILILIFVNSTVLAQEKPLISDPNVEKAIRASISKSDGVLTKSDLLSVKSLNFSFFSGFKLTEIPAGLEKFPNLTMLYLGPNFQLTSLDGLEKLTQLKVLHLDGTKLTKIPVGLEKLTNLTTLSLSANQLTSVAGLEKLTKLTM